jgi:hypothetical protein
LPCGIHFFHYSPKYFVIFSRFNPLKAELNPICHLLALLRAHHILHVSRIRIKTNLQHNTIFISWKFLVILSVRKLITFNNNILCAKNVNLPFFTLAIHLPFFTLAIQWYQIFSKINKLSAIQLVPYFSIDNAHLMYNAHPKYF